MYLDSGSYKANPRNKETKHKKRRDTRNSWHEFMFVSRCRYKVFRKQKTIDTCVEGFRSLESLGFEFKDMGFALNHVHFSVNVPKRYSVQDAENMLKSRSSQRIFARIPNFRKRYPRGSFWSGYEHHQSIGKDMAQSTSYIRNQPHHHNAFSPKVKKAVFGFAIKPLTCFAQTASGDTACSPPN